MKTEEANEENWMDILLSLYEDGKKEKACTSRIHEE